MRSQDSQVLWQASKCSSKQRQAADKGGSLHINSLFLYNACLIIQKHTGMPSYETKRYYTFSSDTIKRQQRELKYPLTRPDAPVRSWEVLMWGIRMQLLSLKLRNRVHHRWVHWQGAQRRNCGSPCTLYLNLQREPLKSQKYKSILS